MVHVETVDLAPMEVQLPMDRVGMVIAQPYVPPNSLTAAEPFCCTNEAKPERLAMLTETLRVSRAASHQAGKTHFTVFPEYSIPGTDGIDLIDAALEADDWPCSTVVIGGIDALDRTQYERLVEDRRTHVDVARNGAPRVPPHCWVNCAVVWVKTADGTFHRWVQPKLHPAWTEMAVLHEHMFRGSSVYIFKGLFDTGVPFRFGALVCFDWIAPIPAQTPPQWILADLHHQANGTQLPLSWLFVIQRNERPSHAEFMNAVAPFFNQTQYPNATRNNACLVFANTAGKATPGRANGFGACSVVLSPQSLFTRPHSVPTFSSGGPKFRDGSTQLAAYNDNYFRERGACIHSFAQVNPASLVAAPAGRTYAVADAYVYPLLRTDRSRAPGAPVSAAIKWLNDELDDVQSLFVTNPASPLANLANTAHTNNINALRAITSQSATHIITLAVQRTNVREHADEWDADDAAALQHLVRTLDIIALGFPPPILEDTPAHAVVVIDGQTMDLCAIRGASHEDCIEHSRKIQHNPQRRLLLISCDPWNTHWDPRSGSFLRPTTTSLQRERNITDPATQVLHLGHQDLLTVIGNSTTTEEVAHGIITRLAA